MSNNNNASPEAMMGFMVLAGLMAIAIFLFYLGVIFCSVVTLVCFWAWNEEREIFGQIITPAEARGFVVCGIIGAAILGGFGLILAQNDYWIEQRLGYFGWGGYIFGSLSFASWCAQQDEQRAQEAAQRQMLNTMQRPTLPERQQISEPREPAREFEYASWDDEEPRA